ncbi:vWA domain-containing protein, partial [Kineosporia sp. R_H_3]|uniref:vWA domain-containing protein n=1 Tax=Kineosporia sp. R_H_3 TaxID=1961848 RepID=UPI00117AFE92
MLVLAVLSAAVGATGAQAGVSPTTLPGLTVKAGSSATTRLSVQVPVPPPRPTPSAVDVELAVDTTGSMADGILQARDDAAALVAGVQAVIPGARFSVVQFRDSTDAPLESAIEQPMTTDGAAVTAALGRLAAGGGADAPEAHNLLFHQAAAADPAVGWDTTPAGAAKLLVVLSDAEPHGAGRSGAAGCIDVSSDPHGYVTKAELAGPDGLAGRGIGLFMVLEPGALSASLPCYQNLALLAGGPSRGFVGGTDLAAQLVPLVTGTPTVAFDVHVGVTADVAGAASWVTTSPTSYASVPYGSTVTPDVVVTVPKTASNGTVNFVLTASADGVPIGSSTLTVTVTGASGGGGGGGGG